MKSDETRPPSRHQLQHAVPTVIHHPEEDMPVLRRWVNRAMENQTRFWATIGTVVVVLIGLVVFISGLSQRREASDEAWTKLESAKSASARVEVAKDFPKTPAGLWALLQAATEYYTQGFADLPANKDVALPTLKKALDLFEKVATDAPPDSAQARVAAFGLARTLEARNDLDKAVAQYERVAATKAWAGTDEAREAARLAKLLTRPETVTFYKNLYAYKPVEAKIAPGGMESLSLPTPFGTSPGSSIGGSGLPSFDLGNLPPPPPSPIEPVTQPKATPLPADVFSPSAPPAPKGESTEKAGPKS